MSIRAKSRRRILILFLIVVFVVGAGATLFIVNKNKSEQQLAALKASGIAAYQAGNYRLAMQELGKYNMRRKSDVETLYPYAMSRLKTPEEDGRHINEGIQALQVVVSLDPSNLNAQRELAKGYQQRGLVTESLDKAEYLLGLDQNDLIGITNKLDALKELRRYREALEYGNTTEARITEESETLAEEDRKDILSAVLANRTTIHLIMNNPALALEPAEQFITLESDQFLGYLRLMDVYRETGRSPEEVIEWAAQLQTNAPDQTQFKILLGRAFLNGNQLGSDPAKREEWRRSGTYWLVESLKALPFEDIPSLTILRFSLDEAFQYDKTLDLLDQLVVQEPNRNDYRSALIRRQYELGLYDETLESLEYFVVNNIDISAPLLVIKSLIHLEREEFDAVTLIEENLRSQANNRYAQIWAPMLNALVSRDDTRIINEAGLVLTQMNNRNGYVSNLRAKAFANVGEYDLAIEDWRAIIEDKAAAAWLKPYLDATQSMIRAQRPQEAFAFARVGFTKHQQNHDAQVNLALAATVNLARLGETERTAVRDLVLQIQQRDAGEPRTLPIYMAMLHGAGGQEQSIKPYLSAINADPPLPAGTYVELASMAARMEYEDELLDRAIDAGEKAHGPTLESTLFQAARLMRDGDTEQVQAYLSERINSAPDHDRPRWELGKVSVLQNILSDNEILNEWKRLGEKYTNNALVQRNIVENPVTWSDRDFFQTSIERLKQTTGETGIGWQLAQARFHLTDPDRSSREIQQAIQGLTRVTQAARQMPEPKILLARAYRMQQNLPAAAEQLQAASRITPDNTALSIELASVLQDMGESDASRDLIQNVLSGGQMNLQNVGQVAVMLAEQGDIQRGIELVESIESPPVQLKLLRANLYRRANDLASTEAILRELVETDPIDVVLETTMNFLAELGKVDEAKALMPVLDSIESLNPAVAELIKGNFHEGIGELDEAMAFYRRAVAADSSNTLAWIRLISFNLVREDLEGTKQAIREAAVAPTDEPAFGFLLEHVDLLDNMTNMPMTRPVIFALVNNANRRETAVEALQAIDGLTEDQIDTSQLVRLRQLADQRPRFFALQQLLIVLYREADLLDDASDLARRAVVSLPELSEPAYLLYDILYRQGRLNEALEASKIWQARLGREAIAAQMAEAEARVAMGDIAGALQSIEPRLALAKENPDQYRPVIMAKFRLLVSDGQIDEAAELVRPLITGDNPNADPQRWRLLTMQMTLAMLDIEDSASRLLDTVRDALPIPNAEEALSLDPTGRRTYEREFVAMSQAYQALAESFDNEVYVQKARDLLEPFTSHPEARSNTIQALAMLEDNFDNDAVAIDLYKRVLDLDSRDHVSMNNLAMIYLEKETDTEVALEYVKQAVALNSNEAAYHDTWALLAARLGDYAQAIEHTEEAISLEPRNPEWKVTMAEILIAAGRFGEAQAYLAEAEELGQRRTLSETLQQRLERARGQMSLVN